ncbi:efflux RND transporter periplasmic adaptor subunit [Oricola thermophila]|uniref:Efflux RND transporter periplasmic adaptor subunit n=1 Tax=Oricola thermophila TaxID=2742145 RepID=A0A6N1VHE4_9HYPH|nr:efflux RND transporter periplasmic adaptor subunit [Oricola thermophila]QKV20184.1 efflux RND transporter periplasmic adaptor subunit [Oricola thermophila]
MAQSLRDKAAWRVRAPLSMETKLKRFLPPLAGIAIVALAWFATFGMPFMEQDPDTGTQGAASASVPPAGGPPGGGPRGRGAGATVVTLAEVEVLPFTEVFRSVGTARAQASVTVETEVAGKVTEVHFGANQEIEAGDPLVSLDDRVEQIALRTARANLAEAKATLERYTALMDMNSGAVSAVNVAEAETQVEIAEADVARAEYDLEQKTIRAPISGTLGLTDVEPGVYLAAASEIVTITDQTHLTIEFGLPDRAANIVQVGQPVRLITGSLPGRVFEGTVEGYDGQIDSTTRTIKVRAGIDNTDGLLLPGMIFNVLLAHENEPLPRVPATAITWSRDGASVWAVEQGKAEPVSVTIRHRADDMVWLDAELEEGRQVVVEGVQKLREGSQVTTAGQMAEAGNPGSGRRNAATAAAEGSAN